MWPPPILHSNPLPAPVSKQIQWAGGISLWAGGAGLNIFVLTTAAALLVINYLHSETRFVDYGMSIGYLAGVVCEVTALVAGIIGRKTTAGKFGIASLGASLVFFVLLVVANYYITKTWPWDGYNDN